MPAQLLQTDALVLLKRPPTDAFQTFTVFAAEHGALVVLQRLAKKSSAASVPLDLFDEAALQLESSNERRTWFVREARLLARPAGIGRGYEPLRLASAFAALLARNPVHDDSRRAVYRLAHQAFAAFATGARPDLVYFKSLYSFARDEGYPVKQDWFASLPAADRTLAARLLNSPLAALETAAPPAPPATPLLALLAAYLRAHTEILLD